MVAMHRYYYLEKYYTARKARLAAGKVDSSTHTSAATIPRTVTDASASAVAADNGQVPLLAAEDGLNGVDVVAKPPAAPFYLFLPPAFLDLFGTQLIISPTYQCGVFMWCECGAGTALGSVGLLYVNPSVWQMLRGMSIIFSAILSIIFLKRKLFVFNCKHITTNWCCKFIRAHIMISYVYRGWHCNHIPVRSGFPLCVFRGVVTRYDMNNSGLGIVGTSSVLASDSGGMISIYLSNYSIDDHHCSLRWSI